MATGLQRVGETGDMIETIRGEVAVIDEKDIHRAERIGE